MILYIGSIRLCDGNVLHVVSFENCAEDGILLFKKSVVQKSKCIGRVCQ